MSDNTLKLIVETINMHEIKESYTGTNSHWSTIGAKRLRSSRMVAGSGIEPLTSGL
jgi:hypothetical protein